MTFADRLDSFKVIHVIFARALGLRLQAKHASNSLADCGVGTVRYRKADGFLRGRECYTTGAYPARMDRWSPTGPAVFLCRQSIRHNGNRVGARISSTFP
jgi:hypothetical protein